MKKLSKRERVEFLLDHWGDFFDPDGATAGYGKTDDAGVALLPLMSRHPSVVELGCALTVVARAWPGHYRHLAGFYSAPWRIVRGFELRRVGSKYVPRTDPMTKRPMVSDDPKKMRRERVVPSWVVMRMVDRGVDGVTFSFRGEVFIPTELL